MKLHALLAQLDRAFASGAKGRGFESHREHHLFDQGPSYGAFLVGGPSYGAFLLMRDSQLTAHLASGVITSLFRAKFQSDAVVPSVN